MAVTSNQYQLLKSQIEAAVLMHQLVRRLKGRKHHNCSFCDKRTIFTGSSPFNMTIHIRYGGISEINPDSRKFQIS